MELIFITTKREFPFDHLIGLDANANFLHPSLALTPPRIVLFPILIAIWKRNGW